MRTKQVLGWGGVLLSVTTLAGLGIGGADGSSRTCLADEACGVGGCADGECCLGCQRVMDNKPIKKTIYCCKLVPFCLPGCQNPLRCGQTCCGECEAQPRWKRVLLKKEIVVGHTCGTKCEVMCHTHGGANGGACGPTAPPAGGPPPAPAVYDAEPARVPAAR